MRTRKQNERELRGDTEMNKAYSALEFEYRIRDFGLKKRRELGITQAELAKRMGVSQSAVSRFESGKMTQGLKDIGELIHY